MCRQHSLIARAVYCKDSNFEEKKLPRTAARCYSREITPGVRLSLGPDRVTRRYKNDRAVCTPFCIISSSGHVTSAAADYCGSRADATASGVHAAAARVPYRFMPTYWVNNFLYDNTIQPYSSYTGGR